MHNVLISWLFSASPSTILSGARDGQIRIWNLPTRKCQAIIQAHHGPVNGKFNLFSFFFHFSKDELFISAYGVIRILNLADSFRNFGGC